MKDETNKKTKKSIASGMIIALVAVCLLLAGVMIFFPFDDEAVITPDKGISEEAATLEIVTTTGKINSDGSITGIPLSFYLKGEGIEAVRFSVKNQYINFVDWTEKRDEFGTAKNFIVPYGADNNEYYSLVITWEPKDYWKAIENMEKVDITSLPQELREDIIVMEITFDDSKQEVKAVKLSLNDDGSFSTSFEDYKITDEDSFVKRADAPIIPREILYAQGSDVPQETKDTSDDNNISTKDDEAKYNFTRFGKDGEIISVSALTDEKLAKEIILDALSKSVAGQGVEVTTLEEYYLIEQTFSATDETHEYYAYLTTDGKSVLQTGKDGMYTYLSKELYDKLDSIYTNAVERT